MQVIVLHPCTKFESRRSPLRKMAHIFRLSINRPIATLTFDLSTSKGARVNHVMGFLPANFQHPICPSTLDVGSGTGQTVRQTTAIGALCPHGGGGIIRLESLFAIFGVQYPECSTFQTHA